MTRTETFILAVSDKLTPNQEMVVEAKAANGSVNNFTALSRIDTPIEIEYYRDSGILKTVLKKLLAVNNKMDSS